MPELSRSSKMAEDDLWRHCDPNLQLSVFRWKYKNRNVEACSLPHESVNLCSPLVLSRVENWCAEAEDHVAGVEERVVMCLVADLVVAATIQTEAEADVVEILEVNKTVLHLFLSKFTKLQPTNQSIDIDTFHSVHDHCNVIQ